MEIWRKIGVLVERYNTILWEEVWERIGLTQALHLVPLASHLEKRTLLHVNLWNRDVDLDLEGILLCAREAPLRDPYWEKRYYWDREVVGQFIMLLKRMPRRPVGWETVMPRVLLPPKKLN